MLSDLEVKPIELAFAAGGKKENVSVENFTAYLKVSDNLYYLGNQHENGGHFFCFGI